MPERNSRNGVGFLKVVPRLTFTSCDLDQLCTKIFLCVQFRDHSIHSIHSLNITKNGLWSSEDTDSEEFKLF